MNGAIADKSYLFAVRIVNPYKFMVESKHEFIISKQILRCGTSIGANVREGQDAQSKADFVNKFGIALKECSETLYWIDLLHDTDFITDAQHDSLCEDCLELKRLLVAIVKTSRANSK